MSDKYFIDSNILVYAHDSAEQIKSGIARKIMLDGILNENIVLSTQVLIEFYVTVTLKIKKKLSPDIAQKEITLLKCLRIIEIDIDIILDAIKIQKNNKLSYWDSLIIASAKRSGAGIIYSEDLNPGQVIDSIKIINPFM